MQSSSPRIEPDIKAVNILMNAYAKLADLRSAQALMRQVQSACGPDIVAPLEPNLVTYNTLLDACHKASDLDAALQAKQALVEAGLEPDARTYTSLIATVARKTSLSAGQHDPTLAFDLLEEMKSASIFPNGMTYSALIDAAGRCQRSDLALQGLRMMLRDNKQGAMLENQVGAWTAAMNACGKAGRWQAALKLFYAMPNFGVEPNTVTCGCLTDALLRAGRTAETLQVLRYMKDHGIVPSKVMYTSLMTRAERLVEVENQQQQSSATRYEATSSSTKERTSDGDTKAIEIYTELMRSLVDSRPQRNGGSPAGGQAPTGDSLLLQVFLVFQQMKAAGAQPDLACYNALLRACARSGDIARAHDVLRQIQTAGLDPNDTSWRQMMQAASTARQSATALSIWKQGMSQTKRRKVVDEPVVQWNPSVESFGVLLTAFLREASASRDPFDKLRFYEQAVGLYDALLLGDEALGMNRIDPNDVLDNQRAMVVVLQAIVGLEGQPIDAARQLELRKMTRSIVSLPCIQEAELNRLGWAAAEALKMARAWCDAHG